jgi:hypothetical protein
VCISPCDDHTEERLLTEEWWRVQAFWFVGDEMRQAEPTHYRSLVEAEQAASEIEETLWHFPTLEVLIAPATLEEARDQQIRHAEERERAGRTVRHLLANDRQTTVCGLPQEQVSAWITTDAWQMGDPDRRCAQCEDERQRDAT